jgi:hypothetical protein
LPSVQPRIPLPSLESLNSTNPDRSSRPSHGLPETGLAAYN